MAELKCCPFCGGEAKVEKYANVVWKVKCTKCPCDMGRLWYKLKTDAVKAWNTRPRQKEEQNG